MATMIIGVPLMTAGAILGITALGIGIRGHVLIKKAINGYNYDAISSSHSALKIEFVTTPGGLGMQLMF
jgi:hypothetical protein